MITYKDSRTFEPTEVIPAATLSEFGEDQMQREFAFLAKSELGVTGVTGWTVTVETRTDDTEEWARTRNAIIFNRLHLKSLAAFK